jgi:mono/diheme cytochrome c family protein
MRYETAAKGFALVMLVSNAGFAHAAPRSYSLPDAVVAFREGPGKEIAENNCLACHSSDYISTQPPNLGKKFWASEVSKMRKAFGAQISDEDAAAITDYLARTY